MAAGHLVAVLSRSLSDIFSGKMTGKCLELAIENYKSIIVLLNNGHRTDFRLWEQKHLTGESVCDL
jgi:hypothetical protein